MTVTATNRQPMLEQLGRYYGEERFAITFTAGITGEDAKRVTSRGWDKTAPLADASFGAALLAGRGLTRNVAVVLRPSNLVVLECDTEGDLARIQGLELPQTLTVRSSKPYKRHFYFRPPHELEALPYVAFRFESGKLTADSGRYFLAPPSLHPSGTTYAFLPDLGPEEVDIAELPERTYRELSQQAQKETSEQRDQIEIDPDAKIQAGNRRDLIFRYACMLRRWGLTRTEISRQCHEFNTRRCSPPVDHALVEIQVDGAMKKQGDQELARAQDVAAEDPEPAAPVRVWYIDAADLLAEPDPGPTRWLVEDLIVDQALIAAVGRWKVTKSYGYLEICIAIATGHPAFGKLAIPQSGPVVFVNEESGRAALWRRLDSLCRGRAINPEELRGKLLVAPNAGVKLDDARWQNELLDLGHIHPRLYVFDPLARMKDAERLENDQTGMAPLIDFMRHLRDQTGAAVSFVHHQGHQSDHMRGSSDLESAWETRLTWKREGQSPLITIESEHREAEAGPPIEYRINWHTDTRTMRFDLVEPDEDALPPLEDRIIEHLKTVGSGTTDEVRKALETRRSDVLRTLQTLEEAGRARSGPSGRRDGSGRPIRDKVWKLSNDAPLWPVPPAGITQDDPEIGQRGPSRRPNILKLGRTDEPDQDDPDADLDALFGPLKPPAPDPDRDAWLETLTTEEDDA